MQIFGANFLWSPPSLIFCLNFCWIPFLLVTSNSSLWFLNSVSLHVLFGISFLNHGPESFFWPKLGQLQIPSHMVSSPQGSQACSTYYSMFENSYFVDFFGGGVPIWLILVSVFFCCKTGMLPTFGQFISLLKSLA